MGTPADVGALYRRHGPLIYRRCLTLLRDPAEAQDATQEVFVRAYRHAELLAAESAARPWLFEVATRYCLNRLRDLARHGKALEGGRREEAGADLGTALADRELVRSVLGRFDEKTSLIAAYVLVDGMSQEQAAAALGVTRKTVGIRLHRFLEGARKYLRRTS